MAGLTPAGLTIQLWVENGRAGRVWYERLLGRPPDFTPFGDDSFCEWIFEPGRWEIHVVETDQPTSREAPVRFGTEDIKAARDQVISLGIAAEPVEDLPGVVRWCNFSDPWGNRLGLYQDLARHP
jgi:catechol 2,3-dioxygenase-like lactoylglutathione lyase family enzyme